MVGRASHRKVLHVLIAEDQKLLGHGLMALLSDVPDMKVVGLVESCESLVAAVEELEPHVVITAVELNGKPTLPWLQQTLRGSAPPRVIVLTAGDDAGEVVDVLDAGADGFVGRQVGVEELLAGIRVVAAGGVFINGADARRLRERRKAVASAHDDGIADRSHDRVNGAGHGERLNGISSREHEILVLIGEGLTNRDIAERLHISIRTVETHRANLKRKLGARTTAELVRRAIQV